MHHAEMKWDKKKKKMKIDTHNQNKKDRLLAEILVPVLWIFRSGWRRTADLAAHARRPNRCKPSNHPWDLSTPQVGSSPCTFLQIPYNSVLFHLLSLFFHKFRHPSVFFAEICRYQNRRGRERKSEEQSTIAAISRRAFDFLEQWNWAGLSWARPRINGGSKKYISCNLSNVIF